MRLQNLYFDISDLVHHTEIFRKIISLLLHRFACEKGVNTYRTSNCLVQMDVDRKQEAFVIGTQH